MLAIAPNDTVYEFVLWLHILCVIIGFGSSFVWPFLAAKSRQLQDPKVGYYVSQMSMQGSSILTSYFIYAAGASGLLLVIFGSSHDPAYIEFSDPWVSIAFLLFIGAVVVAQALHVPNLKAMLGLQEQMASAPPPASGPPPQLAELEERGKKAGMYGGILHLLFVLLLLDMVFQPT